jgi:hypothetical protein
MCRRRRRVGRDDALEREREAGRTERAVNAAVGLGEDVGALADAGALEAGDAVVASRKPTKSGSAVSLMTARVPSGPTMT